MQQYNTFQYNTEKYNNEYEVWVLRVHDELNLSRFSKYNSNKYNTQRYNASSTSDELSKSWSVLITDSQFIQDNNIQKTPSKGFSDEVRLAIWLSNKRVNSANWSD